MTGIQGLSAAIPASAVVPRKAQPVAAGRTVSGAPAASGKEARVIEGEVLVGASRSATEAGRGFQRLLHAGCVSEPLRRSGSSGAVAAYLGIAAMGAADVGWSPRVDLYV